MRSPISNPLVLASFLVLAACSSSPTVPSSTEARVAATGPTILNARSSPNTVELDSSLQAKQSAQVLADVKDFTSPINKVTLRFTDVPIEIDMQNLQGTTWETTLSPDHLKKLAVSGKSIKYQVEVVATDKEGRSATSSEPVMITIKAPELARAAG